MKNCLFTGRFLHLRTIKLSDVSYDKGDFLQDLSFILAMVYGIAKKGREARRYCSSQHTTEKASHKRHWGVQLWGVQLSMMKELDCLTLALLNKLIQWHRFR